MRSITAKIIVLAATAVILVAGVLAGTFVVVLSRSSEAAVASLERTLREDFDLLIKSEVETAASMLKRIAKLRDEGKLSEREADETARALLRDIRFGADGYFWADTKEGVNVVLLGGASEGKSRIDLKDVKGFELVKAIIAAGVVGAASRTTGSPGPARRRPCPSAATAFSYPSSAGSSARATTSTPSTRSPRPSGPRRRRRGGPPWSWSSSSRPPSPRRPSASPSSWAGASPAPWSTRRSGCGASPPAT